jgi:histidine ammonia-lyase
LWEGVDFPGEALEILVVAKLPFSVPTNRWSKRAPSACASRASIRSAPTRCRMPVLRFRQGVGRLIRRADDRGVLVVCDPRLGHGVVPSSLPVLVAGDSADGHGCPLAGTPGIRVSGGRGVAVARAGRHGGRGRHRSRCGRPRSGARVIELGARPLTLADVAAVSRDRAPVRLGSEARARISASRGVVERALAAGKAIYGVNTGFGPLKDKAIASDQVRQLQLNLLRSHAAGIGRFAPMDVSRAMLLLRAASLAHGHSGCRPEVVEALLALLDGQVTPVVPLQGSVGASGDLAPLAHLALVLVGEGEAWLGDQRMPGALALRGAGLQPLTLEAKEGLALINGTQLSTALAALACVDARRVWEAGVAAAALSTEVLLGSFQPARADVQALRPYRGADETARRLRAYSEDSDLVASHANCGEVQDAYSLRCVPQVMGASWDALAHVEAQLTVEANSVNDNPLVLAAGDEVISAGLFHAQPVALVADYLKIAVAEVASLAERRIDRLTDARVSGCPRHSPGAGTRIGIHDGAIHRGRAGLGEQDAVSPGQRGFDSDRSGHRRSRQHGADRGPACPPRGRQRAHVVALELMCATRALEFRRPLRAGQGCERLYGTVRRLVPEPEGDRPLSGACEELARWVLSPAPIRLAEDVLST